MASRNPLVIRSGISIPNALLGGDTRNSPRRNPLVIRSGISIGLECFAASEYIRDESQSLSHQVWDFNVFDSSFGFGGRLVAIP